MARKFFVGGNFKMNPSTTGERMRITSYLNAASLDPAVEIVVAPPALYLMSVKQDITSHIGVASQNCYIKDSGAYTGEISCVAASPL
jgi:triosephosphate isomerase